MKDRQGQSTQIFKAELSLHLSFISREKDNLGLEVLYTELAGVSVVLTQLQHKKFIFSLSAM